MDSKKDLKFDPKIQVVQSSDSSESESQTNSVSAKKDDV